MVNSRLLCNRATALATKKDADHAAAIKDCDKAIYMDDTYQKAYLRRADCYMSMNGEDEKAEITKVSQSVSQSAVGRVPLPSPPLCYLLYFSTDVRDTLCCTSWLGSNWPQPPTPPTAGTGGLRESRGDVRGGLRQPQGEDQEGEGRP